MLNDDLWTDGLICAFELVRSHKKTTSLKTISPKVEDKPKPGYQPESQTVMDMSLGNHWIPVGWSRVSELLQTIQIDIGWDSHSTKLSDDEEDIAVADVASPYWEKAVGPTWWCHVAASHPMINTWLSTARWLHPAISIALRDESKLISERMKHLLYEVPVRVAGGLLFELLGQSAGDPFVDEDDIPIVLRSWQAKNFLVTALHVKGASSNINVLGIAEVEELLVAGSSNVPKTIYEVIALLACRLARWDDRLFRKSIFGVADEVELKFMNRCVEQGKVVLVLKALFSKLA